MKPRDSRAFSNICNVHKAQNLVPASYLLYYKTGCRHSYWRSGCKGCSCFHETTRGGCGCLFKCIERRSHQSHQSTKKACAVWRCMKSRLRKLSRVPLNKHLHVPKIHIHLTMLREKKMWISLSSCRRSFLADENGLFEVSPSAKAGCLNAFSATIPDVIRYWRAWHIYV